MTRSLPSYRQLLMRTDAPKGSTWGLFGDDLGTLGMLDESHARVAAGCVRTGETFALNYPINAFDPPMLPTRLPARLQFMSRHREHLDDHLDGFNPQSSSQIDGLRHRQHEKWGYYNGYVSDDIRPDSSPLGVQLWAERGIVGRGVLLDVQRTIAGNASDGWHRSGGVVTASDLERTRVEQSVNLAEGDIVLLHTGWADWYLRSADRDEIRAAGLFTGLAQSRDALEWIWDHGIAMLASDTYALERMPPIAGSDFETRNDGKMMHQELLALLGLGVGELWKLSGLAAACSADQRWTCLLTSAPLNVPGGVSTPANALAIR